MCEHSHHITHHKPKKENTKKKFLGRVLGPDGSPHHISPSHIRERKEEVLGPSSWAGWLTTPHLTIIHHKPKEENTKKKFLGRVLGPDGSPHHISPSHITSRKKRTQRRSSWAEFLGRMAFSTPSHITSRKKRTQRRSSWAEFLGRMYV